MRKIFAIIVAVVILVSAAGYYFFIIKQNPEKTPPKAAAFDADILIKKAKDLASEDYIAPGDVLPQDLKDLDYDQHRDIRFVRDNGPWFGHKLPFEVQFFHLGSMFQIPVPIFEIVGGKASPIKYSSKFFDYGKNYFKEFQDDLGYAGFRLHAPLNTAKYYDELVSFLGASYFRALGKGQKYGLSARGLAIDTAEQTGEEFPVFKEFYIEKPSINATFVKVYALLDSPSVAGAYVFKISPGKTTVMDVKSTLFPRKDIKKLGVAPLTSMFLFGENTKNRFDDHRPEVHDSDGLLVWNGKDEWLWRPLDNSKYLRISSFVDENPKGFGLLQRDRNPAHYLDFETNYELRPSLWVKPDGDWHNGSVQLVEIPSQQEIHDNIVAYWVPEKKIKGGEEYKFDYTLYWGNEIPDVSKVATVTSTYFGVGGVSGMLEVEKRKFVVDFNGTGLKKGFDDKTISLAAVASEGTISGTHLVFNPVTKGLTAYVDFVPNDKTSEIRISLVDQAGKPVSEIWSYQWLH